LISSEVKISTPSEFERFRPIIESLPLGAKTSERLRVGETARHRLYYVPFEHANLDARLVIVGITPGPNQLELAIQAVQRLKNLPAASVQLEVKKQASFGSPTMRPNLLKMLAHFQVRERLGIATEADLWGPAWSMFQATSVVPHAAFDVKSDGSEKMFNGKFTEVLSSTLLRRCFEDSFLPLVRAMDRSALWVGLGPTPRSALEWCVERGLLRREQVAAFTHPSTSAGSQVNYFVKQRTRSSFDPKDPVLKRCDWLDAAYELTQRAFDETLPLPHGSLKVGARDIRREAAQ
jgi:hypothetical protein